MGKTSKYQTRAKHYRSQTLYIQVFTQIQFKGLGLYIATNCTDNIHEKAWLFDGMIISWVQLGVLP